MKAFFLTVLSFVIACNVYAQSPKQPLTHTNHAHETSKPDERGTEQSPIIIKVLPPLNEDEKTAADKQERQDKSESDWWLVKLTGVLAFIGIIQIIVFGLQARRLRQTVQEMKIATKATEKAAEAAEKSVGLAQHEFIARHRPYVYVFGVSQLQFSAGEASLTYSMANYGETPAVIHSLSVGITTSQSAEPDDLPIQAATPHTVVDSPIFAPQEKREIKQEAPDGIPFVSIRRSALAPFTKIARPDLRDKEEMFFMIIVHYGGPFTQDHESRFCWRLDLTSDCFIQFGGEKYNYAK